MPISQRAKEREKAAEELKQALAENIKQRERADGLERLLSDAKDELAQVL